MYIRIETVYNGNHSSVGIERKSIVAVFDLLYFSFDTYYDYNILGK